MTACAAGAAAVVLVAVLTFPPTMEQAAARVLSSMAIRMTLARISVFPTRRLGGAGGTERTPESDARGSGTGSVTGPATKPATGYARGSAGAPPSCGTAMEPGTPKASSAKIVW